MSGWWASTEVQREAGPAHTRLLAQQRGHCSSAAACCRSTEAGLGFAEHIGIFPPVCAARCVLCRAIRFGAVLENVVVNETTREVDYVSK